MTRGDAAVAAVFVVIFVVAIVVVAIVVAVVVVIAVIAVVVVIVVAHDCCCYGAPPSGPHSSRGPSRARATQRTDCDDSLRGHRHPVPRLHRQKQRQKRRRHHRVDLPVVWY